jgi:hypothetical protein
MLLSFHKVNSDVPFGKHGFYHLTLLPSFSTLNPHTGMCLPLL